MKTFSKQEGKRYSCPECPYVVDRQDRLKTHQEKKHTKKIANSIKCTYCQNVFSSKTNQKQHEKTHLPPPAQSKEFACDICEFRLRTSSPRVSPLSSPRVVNSVSLSIN